MLIKPAADPEKEQRIEKAQAMKGQAWNITIDYNCPKILDIYIDRVKKKQTLNFCRVKINGIENCGQISQKSQENIIHIFSVPKKNIQSR